MKILNTVLKVVLSLILLLPIAGTFGLFPEPTQDMYNTPEAFQFIELLSQSKYVVYINTVVFILSLGLLWTRRTPLAALLLLPVTVNIVGFHAFLDGGPFTQGAIMGNTLFLLNLYFLWQSRSHYAPLFKKSK